MTETIEYHDVVDKTKWPDGPWKDEVDKLQYSDPVTGLPCLVKRNNMGALCGYVGVPSGQPYYGQGYDDPDVEVHGGLTYAAPCSPHDEGDEGHAICHIPGKGEPDDVYWFGFDCAHAGDLVPRYSEGWNSFSLELNRGSTYKTVEYVKQENAELARQLAALISA